VTFEVAQPWTVCKELSLRLYYHADRMGHWMVCSMPGVSSAASIRPQMRHVCCKHVPRYQLLYLFSITKLHVFVIRSDWALDSIHVLQKQQAQAMECCAVLWVQNSFRSEV
jgi:hypothetical protein